MSKGRLVTTIDLVAPPLVAVSLLATLFPVSRPSMAALHPWKIELLVSTVLLIFAALILWNRPDANLRKVKRSNSYIWVSLFFVLFLLWNAASVIWAYSPYSVLHHSFVWLSYLFFFLLALLYFERSRSISIVTSTFIWLCILIGSICLIDYISVPDFEILEGTLRRRYAKYAELLGTILPVVWMAAVYTRRKTGFLMITGVGAMGWLVVMLSLSKGAFIAGVAGFIVMAAGCFLFSHRAFRARIMTSFGVWLFLTIFVQATFSLFSPVPATADYISGAADTTRETSMMRVFTWNVSKQMFEDNWITGVGANNFGVSFNAARRSYREKYPDDKTIEYGEDYVVERAHNEPLQVAAELGIVGILLFTIPFLLIAFWTLRTFKNNHFRLSPMLWACIGGVSSFAVSSSVSSFSFRAVQNGVVFFLVLAIAVHELIKAMISIEIAEIRLPRQLTLHWAALAVFVILLIQTAFFSSRGAAEYLAIAAATKSDHEEAIKTYDLAFKLDPNYPSLMIHSAWRSELYGDSPAAVHKMRRSIDDGMGVPTTYSTLAKYQTNAGLPDDAEQTLIEAIHIFPRSVFLRTRLAVLLQISGKFTEAEVQLDAAANIDSRQAAGWYNLIQKGSLAAFLEAQTNKNAALPADLVPLSIVREYLDDTEKESGR